MAQQMIKEETKTRMNGLDTEALFGTLAAIEQTPTLADFEFRASNQWISGGENRSRIKEFFGVGAEDESRSSAFEFTNGELTAVCPVYCTGHCNSKKHVQAGARRKKEIKESKEGSCAGSGQ